MRETATEVIEANQRRERHGMGGSEGRMAAWVVARAVARAAVVAAEVCLVAEGMGAVTMEQVKVEAHEAEVV